MTETAAPTTPRARWFARRAPTEAPRPPSSAPPRVRELPEQLLRRLELTVLKRLDGFFFGDYSGIFYGPSLDLAEVREYQPGDEVRRIDWNVTARSGGRLHVRQYREEREITAWVVLDGGNSMHFGTRRTTKYGLGLEFAALIARIVTRHGDKVGAVATNAHGLKLVSAGSGRTQALRIVSELESYPAPSITDHEHLREALERVEKTLRRRAMIFVVSDFMRGTDWVSPLSRLSHKHDVIAVRVTDPVERELPRVGGVRFRDPSSGLETWVDTADPRVRAQHQKIVLERNARIELALKRAQVDTLELQTERDSVQPVLKFALKRKGRR